MATDTNGAPPPDSAIAEVRSVLDTARARQAAPRQEKAAAIRARCRAEGLAHRATDYLRSRREFEVWRKWVRLGREEFAPAEIALAYRFEGARHSHFLADLAYLEEYFSVAEGQLTRALGWMGAPEAHADFDGLSPEAFVEMLRVEVDFGNPNHVQGRIDSLMDTINFYRDLIKRTPADEVGTLAPLPPERQHAAISSLSAPGRKA